MVLGAETTERPHLCRDVVEVGLIMEPSLPVPIELVRRYGIGCWASKESSICLTNEHKRNPNFKSPREGLI